jgi:LuxR family maltose regulon positive regulatory protein
VTRPRLLGQLSHAVQRSPLTLVSGPAGSGKTVLVAAWREAGARSRPIAWLTLDGYDDEPAGFWSYVVEALRGVGVPLADLPSLTPGEPVPGGFVPALAAALAAQGTPAVLILDNADHLADRTIIAGLDLLVRNTGDCLRMVLCARADPLLPLHQYRLAGTMSEIRGAQLAFTPEETRQLLAAMGVPVSPDVAERLCVETQGWAVGLRLAAAPLKQGVPPDRLVTSLAHDDGTVAQYLFAEVLAGQPAGVRRLLLRISVAEELDPDLVDRLSGRPHSRRVLAALAHANAFVEESAGAAGGFRIHPLFREMLRAQLGFDHPAEVAGLHRTCAVWYASVGRPTQAIEHALAAGDWPFAARLLVDDMVVPRLLAHGSAPDVADLRELPSGLGGPDAAVLRSASALAAGQRPADDDLAGAAEATGAGRPALRVAAVLTGLTAAVAAGADEARAEALAGSALDAFAELPDLDRQARRDCLAVVAGARAFAALDGDGPVEDAMAQMRAAAAAAHAASARRLRCRTVAVLALLEMSAGQLSRAMQHATEAESLCADAGTDEQQRPIASATALAGVHLQRYALGEAQEWLTRALTRERHAAGAPEDALSAAVLAVVQAQSLRLRREYESAEATLGEHLSREELPGWVRQRVLLEAARLALARGRREEALRILDDPVLESDVRLRMRATTSLVGADGAALALVPEAHGAAPVHAVDSLVVRACQLAESAKSSLAVEELGRALQVARPELLRLPFVDAPPPVRRLLRSHPRLQGPAAWLSPSSTAGRPSSPPAGGAAGPAAPMPPTQELSERESEVLQHLAEMLSTAEIAAAMFISVNTVRTHIRSILRKLGVTRRNQAVRRARDLRLL